MNLLVKRLVGIVLIIASFALFSSRASADFNCDSVLDFFDYLDFVDAFAAGC